jgi:hypothetical protein
MARLACVAMVRAGCLSAICLGWLNKPNSVVSDAFYFVIFSSITVATIAGLAFDADVDIRTGFHSERDDSVLPPGQQREFR